MLDIFYLLIIISNVNNKNYTKDWRDSLFIGKLTKKVFFDSGVWQDSSQRRDKHPREQQLPDLWTEHFGFVDYILHWREGTDYLVRSNLRT